MRATPPKTPKANASPFGLTRVASVNRPPERKGPTARPAAESVWARPLRVPRTEGFEAELVIYESSAKNSNKVGVGSGFIPTVMR